MSEKFKVLARETLRIELHFVRYLSELLLPDGAPDIIKIPRHDKINAQIKWLQKVSQESLQIERDQPNLKQLRESIGDAIVKNGTPLDRLGNLTDGHKIGEKYVWFNYTYNIFEQQNDANPWEMTNEGFTLTVSDDFQKHENTDPYDANTFASFTPKGRVKSIYVDEITPDGIFKKYEPRTLRTASIVENGNTKTKLESWSNVIETINQIIPNLSNTPQK